MKCQNCIYYKDIDENFGSCYGVRIKGDRDPRTGSDKCRGKYFKAKNMTRSTPKLKCETKRNILIINGSPQKNGNTAKLVEWFSEGACSNGGQVEIVRAASLASKAHGCTSCRKCQKRKKYECVINDEVTAVLKKMAQADTVVFATPLYFYGPSAQLKMIIDRMFSLYKWNNAANTFESPMRGKSMVLLLSAYEDVGLDLVKESFKVIAGYSGRSFHSFLVSNAGESTQIDQLKGIRKKAVDFGKKLA
jgi:multimeric flavodoxin WrbA